MATISDEGYDLNYVHLDIVHAEKKGVPPFLLSLFPPTTIHFTVDLPVGVGKQKSCFLFFVLVNCRFPPMKANVSIFEGAKPYWGSSHL